MGKNAAELLTIKLPEALAKRVKSIYEAAEAEKRRVQNEADKMASYLLEGFLAGHAEADGRHFSLSDDGGLLVETPPPAQI